MTVLGPIDPSQLGITLTHEHVVTADPGDPLRVERVAHVEDPAQREMALAPVDITNLGLIDRNTNLFVQNLRLDDLELAIQELNQFVELGGNSLVDCSVQRGHPHNPGALRKAAKATGLNIIAATGWYVAATHPPELAEQSIDTISERFVKEIEEGYGEGEDLIRTGIIKIGTTHPLPEGEIKVLRAAARASIRTGVPVTLHLCTYARGAHQVVDTLTGEGLHPSRIVCGHLDFVLGHLDLDFHGAMAYYQSLGDRGVFLEFDLCGVERYFKSVTPGRPNHWAPHDLERARAIRELVRRGYERQLLLSHDVCTKRDLVRYGGFGYGHILRDFVHNLTDMGVSEAAVDQMIRENPRRALTPSQQVN